MIDNPLGVAPHFEGDLLPPARRKKTRARALSGALGQLESLLEFREDMDDWKAEGRLMQAYQEHAEDMMIARDTLRRYVGTIRNYSADDLVRWVEAGAWMEHIEVANTLAEIAKKTPKQLMEECVNLGDETGKTMTVEKLTAHALGEQPRKDPVFYRLNNLFSQLGKFPTLLKWDTEKTGRFTKWLDAGREFLG
jgi:hypothetical protein